MSLSDNYYGLLGGSLILKMKRFLYLSKCFSVITSVRGQLIIIRSQCGKRVIVKKKSSVLIVIASQFKMP